MVSSLRPKPAVAAHKGELRSLLCDGRRLDDDSPSTSLEVLESLQNLGLITVGVRHFVRCVNPDDDDFEAVETPECEGIVYLDAERICTECGRVIEGIERKHVFRQQTIRLDSEGILSFVHARLKSLPCVRKITKEERAVFRIGLRGDAYCFIVLINDQLGYVSSIKYRYVGQFFSEPVLYVPAEGTIDVAPHLLERIRFARLEDFIADSDDQLCDDLRTVSQPRLGDVSYAGTEQLLAAYLKRHSWQHFQNVLILEFYKYCQSHPKLVDHYLTTLKRDRGTFLASFPVSIGGAGKTDFRLIEKLDYLQTLFQARVIGDAKFYARKTRLASKEIDTIHMHLSTDAGGSKSVVAIVFVTSDQIESTVWDKITMLKNNAGEWKVVVIPKYLLLELIQALNATHLLR